MNKIFKIAIAILLSALTLFGATACGKVETPQAIKEFLCVEHKYGVGEVERWPTCLREGKVKYTCTECGNVKFEVLEKSNHTPYTVPAREATCAQSGYSEHTACAVCGTVISGKTTTPKTTCDHTNDFYAGMGVYECGLCGDERMEYQENIVTFREFDYGYWYRFYLPKTESKAWILFENLDETEPYIAVMEHMSGTIIKYKYFAIGFDNSASIQDGFIWLFDDERNLVTKATVDITFGEAGADYVQFYLGQETYTGYLDGDRDAVLNVYFDLREVTPLEIEVEGGAKMAQLPMTDERIEP